jgi:Fe-Mn family superoxide dismutase
MTIDKKELIEKIRKDLNLDKNSLKESLVAQPKTFDLTTELLSKATKENHIELYDQYIKDFNQISNMLDVANRLDSSSNGSPFRSLKIDETYNLNASYLHELYFRNISDLHSNIPMDSLAYMRISRDFGTFDAWQQDFIACCLASRCGWAVTYYNTYTQTLMNCVIDLHSINVPIGAYPVIVMDVWQHAYYRDYLSDVKSYVFGMMKQLNWNVIEKRIRKSDDIGKIVGGE